MKLRTIFASIIAIAVCGIALAATLTAKWTAPTTNVDGSTISAPLTYNVYSGPTGAESVTATGLTTTTDALTVAAGAPDCVQVSAVANGQESARTPEVCATASFPTPNAPTGVTFQ